MFIKEVILVLQTLLVFVHLIFIQLFNSRSDSSHFVAHDNHIHYITNVCTRGGGGGGAKSLPVALGRLKNEKSLM